MDVQDWKRLNREEKERVWETLSQAEKAKIMSAKQGKRRSGGKHRSSRVSAGSRRGHSATMPMLLRSIAAIAAVLIPLAIFLGSHVGVGLEGWLTPVSILLLVVVTALGFALHLEQQEAGNTELAEVVGLLALHKPRYSKDQPKNASRDSTT